MALSIRPCPRPEVHRRARLIYLNKHVHLNGQTNLFSHYINQTTPGPAIIADNISK